MDNSVKDFLNSGAGKQLKDYLFAKLIELKDIENIHEKDIASQQIIEIKSQKRAYKKLKEILGDIMDLSAEVKKRDPRDSFEVGLDEE